MSVGESSVAGFKLVTHSVVISDVLHKLPALRDLCCHLADSAWCRQSNAVYA